MADTPNTEASPKPREPLTIDLAPEPSPPAASPSDGFGLAAAAAAMGGVLGLAASLTVASIGLWPSSRSVAPPVAGDAAQVKALEAKVADLSKRLEEVRAAPAGQSVVVADPRTGELEARLSKVEPVLAEAAALRQRADDQAARLEALAKAPASPPVPPPSAQSLPADLLPRLAALESRAVQLPTVVAATPAPELEARLAELRSRIEALSARPAADPSADLKETLAAQAAAVADLRALSAAQEKSLADVNGRMIQLVARVGATQEARSDAVLALVLNELKSAVDQGRPFADELALAARVAPATNLSALAPFADKGMPTASSLAEQVAGMSRRMREVAAADTAAPSSVVDRLMSSARQSLDVRKVDPAGDTLESRLIRLERALAGGDVRAALAAWQGLPDPVRALRPEFGAALAARAEADQLLRTAVRNAMNKLTGHAE